MSGKLAEIEVRVAFQPVLRTADLKEAVRRSFARDLGGSGAGVVVEVGK